jgi:hypothetical protein
MTASAIYTFLHSPARYEVDDIDQLLHDARSLEPIGRLFRRLGAALCAVMISETAASMNSIAELDPLPLTRTGVHVSSTIASVFAVAECILAVLFVNDNASAKYYSPRLDDQFNGEKPAMILGAIAVIILIIGSISVMTTAVKASKASSRVQELTVVSTMDSHA